MRTRTRTHTSRPTTKKNFDEFKILWEGYLQLPECTDIQSPKNVIDWVRYVTKEDYRSVAVGADKDLVSTLCKAYICAQKWERLMPTLAPYCYLTWIEKKVFESQFKQFRMEVQEEKT